MKKILLIATIFMVCFLSINVYAATPQKSSNFDNLDIYPYLNFGDGAHIQYADTTTEKIGPNYIALVINGAFIKQSPIVIYDSTPYIPLRAVSEALGAKVTWDTSAQKIDIADGTNRISLFIGKSICCLNGKTIKLASSPILIDGSTFVELSTFSTIFNADVSYYDGQTEAIPHLITGLPQILIDRYSTSEAPITQDTALQALKAQLIIAYTNKFGKFVLWDNSDTSTPENDKDRLRKIISNLTVDSESGSFYKVKVMFEFWINKYTGQIYVFYNGINKHVYVFNPDDSNVLSFSG